MKTWVHLVVSILLAAALYPLFKWNVFLILIGGVLIDADHYLWSIYRYEEFDIVKSYKFYIKNMVLNDFTNVYGILLIFHTVEFLFIMVLLSFYNKLTRRKLLKKQLAKESRAVSGSSLEVLHEFERMEDELA